MMLRNLLLAAALMAVFAAGYCFRPSPTGRGGAPLAAVPMTAPAPAPAEPLALPPLLRFGPPKPDPGVHAPAGEDMAADVIRSHFNTLAGLNDAGKKAAPADAPKTGGFAVPVIDSAESMMGPQAKRSVVEAAVVAAARPRSSASGVLRRAPFFIDNRQGYALDDESGKLLYYVTADDRLDLTSYDGRRVELAGVAAKRADLRGALCMHVTQVLTPPVLPAQVFRSRTSVVSFPFQVSQAGPSGIREAQLWMTQDDGKSWQLLAKQAGSHSPIQARLPGDGRYGFRLVLVGGDGAATEPPQPGNAPEMMIALETRDHVVPQGRLLPITTAVEDAPMPREANQPQPIGRPAPVRWEAATEWLPMPRTIESLPMPRQVNPPEQRSPGSNVGHLPIPRPTTALWPHPAENFVVAMGGMHVRSRSAATFSGMMAEERQEEDASSLSAYMNLPNGVPAAHLHIPGLPALLEAVGP